MAFLTQGHCPHQLLTCVGMAFLT